MLKGWLEVYESELLNGGIRYMKWSHDRELFFFLFCYCRLSVVILLQDQYVTHFAGMVKNARPIHGTDAVLKVSNIDGDVRILYKDQEDFERFARQFGIFKEWKVVELCIHLDNCRPVILFVFVCVCVF